MRKQSTVNFVVPHESIRKSLKTIVLSKGTKYENKASGIPSMSKPKLGACLMIDFHHGHPLQITSCWQKVVSDETRRKACKMGDLASGN